jgi:putative flavoprotein involved in K+ transport
VTRTEVETVIIGGGHAGLAMSSCLSELGHEHVVLERGRVGERWRRESWDSFRFQGPNWATHLPGAQFPGDPDGFATAPEFIDWLTGYADAIAAPLWLGTTVDALTYDADVDRYDVATDRGPLRAHSVVVATGAFQRPAVPTVATEFPPSIFQITSASYQSPALLPDGAVLVVGSGSAGCQIVDDLVEAGRRVYLSLGSHNRVPRSYRGKDVIWWLFELGEYDRVPSPRQRPTKSGPGILITGARGGRTIDLRDYVREGVTLLGRVRAIDGFVASFTADAKATIANGDVMFDRLTRAADYHVKWNGLDLPDEPAPMSTSEPVAEIDTVDLRAAGIGAVVWACGRRREYSWLRIPVLDEGHRPVHTRGVTAFPGLYFLGLTWQHKIKSGFVCGAGEDAEYLAARFAARVPVSQT